MFMDTDTHWSKSTAAEKSIPNKSETEFGKCCWPKTGMMMKKQWESGNDIACVAKDVRLCGGNDMMEELAL